MATDFRFALRLFGRRPGFVLIALLTLGLGIGANTAIFSLVKPILLEGLPYPAGDRLVAVFERDNDGADSYVGYSTFADLRADARAVDGLVAMGSWQPTLMGRGDSEPLQGQRVTAGFFSLLGIEPALGRDFRPDEDNPRAPRVAIIGYGLWQSRFGADPGIVGRTITLDEFPYQIVGVLPPEYESLLQPGAVIWSPLRYDASLPWACRTCRHLQALGRLRPGATASEAAAELSTLADRLRAAYPAEYPGRGMAVRSLQAQLTRSSRAPLWALFGAVGLVLLLACVNVANLFLGQATGRIHEFAVRTALGAPRQRVMRQVLLETALLGLAGAGLGAGLAAGLVRLVRSYGPASLPRLATVGVDWTVLGFAAATGLAAGLAFGIGPALWATRQGDRSWRSAGRIAGRERHLGRRALVVAEMAIALTLVVGAGLLVRSMGKLLAVNPGFEPDRLLTMNLGLVGRKFDSSTVALAYYDRALASARSVPGVAAAGLVSLLPLGGNQDSYGVRIEAKPEVPAAQRPSADRFAVSGDYLAAMGIPLIRGRLLGPADRANALPVVLINETMARLEWPGRDPVGQRIQVGEDTRPWWTIVGVVGDVRHGGLDQPPNRQIYFPEEQWFFTDPGMVLVTRTTLDPDRVAPTLRAAIKALDRDPTVDRGVSMEAVIRSSTAARRFVLSLFQAFALVALILAAAGVYGVMASRVAERFKEFGIRTALGASRQAIHRQVIGEALGLGATGIAVGGVAAIVLSRLTRSLLFDVSPNDPTSYVVGALILGAIAIGAAWVPAVRAARLDPTVTLRSD
jgi:putative ABC transport system permease protein